MCSLLTSRQCTMAFQTDILYTIWQGLNLLGRIIITNHTCLYQGNSPSVRISGDPVKQAESAPRGLSGRHFYLEDITGKGFSLKDNGSITHD